MTPEWSVVRGRLMAARQPCRGTSTMLQGDWILAIRTIRLPKGPSDVRRVSRIPSSGHVELSAWAEGDAFDFGVTARTCSQSRGDTTRVTSKVMVTWTMGTRALPCGAESGREVPMQTWIVNAKGLTGIERGRAWLS